jgi:hypothetical protein
MQNNQLPYDTSFAQSFNWSEQAYREKALEILNSQLDGSHDGQKCVAGKPDYQPVELLLASNPSTPMQVLDHIAQCVKCPKVLERIAGHPNTGRETLLFLSQSDHHDVRSAVAENSNTDLEILRSLVRDGNTDVRFCLAENPNVPEELLQELSADDNPYVAYRAQTTLIRVGSKQQQGIVKTMTPQAQPKSTRRAM